MRSRGFTVIEILVTITIMAILLVVGVVNLRSTQVSARDTERKTDIDSLSLGLEAFYKTGTDGSTAFGRYPSTAIFTDATDDTLQTVLRDTDIKSMIAPGASTATSSFIGATNNTQTTSGVLPTPTTSTYLYQPLLADGSLCTLETLYCQKYNLYYKLEGDSTVYMVTSKHQ